MAPSTWTIDFGVTVKVSTWPIKFVSSWPVTVTCSRKRAAPEGGDRRRRRTVPSRAGRSEAPGTAAGAAAAGRLGEVEVGGEIAEHGAFSRTSGRGSGRPSVGGSMRWPPRKSSSMNLSVRVEAQRLVVDVARLRVRADDESGHPQAVAVLVDARRGDVVVEAAPVVPGEEDRGRVPVGAAHDRVDQARHVGLADGDRAGPCSLTASAGVDPGHRRQRSGSGRGVEVVDRLHVAELAVLRRPCRSTAAGSRSPASPRSAAPPGTSSRRPRSPAACPGRRSSPSSRRAGAAGR